MKGVCHEWIEFAATWFDVGPAGDGSGGFGARTEFGVGLLPHQLILADVDADGGLDILTVNAHMLLGSFPNPIPPGSLSILLGDGQGGFSNRVDYDLGRLPLSMAVGDIDHDGELDILIGNHEDKTVSILRVQRRANPMPG